MRIQKCVRQPRVNQLLARARFRIHRIGLRLPGGNIRAQRAVIAGMQHVVRRDLRQIHRKLRAIRLSDRMQHHVHLLQRLARRGFVTNSSPSLSMWLVLETSLACCRPE